jgi:hypothetical protein
MSTKVYSTDLLNDSGWQLFQALLPEPHLINHLQEVNLQKKNNFIFYRPQQRYIWWGLLS